MRFPSVISHSRRRYRDGGRRRVHWILLLVLAFNGPATIAAELEYASVVRADTQFLIDFRLKLQVTKAQAQDYFTDYAALARMSPTTQESGLVDDPDSDKDLLRVVLKPCVLVFCKKLVKVSEVYEIKTDTEFLRRFEVRPELSDFRQATETLTFESSDDGTLFVYNATLEPAFYVPGFIASWLIRRTLIDDLLQTGRAVEQAHAD